MKLADLTEADRYLNQITELPPAPTVAIDLLGLFGDPNIDIDRVITLIRQDPSLTANVIKMCNSPFFRGAEPSNDIFEAITHLGFYEVYRVVASLLGARAMSTWKVKGSLNINDLWRHSVVSAVAAGRLARRVEESEAVAYTAGLLHDIGKLVFASVEGARYADLVRKAEASGNSIADAERAAFGVDHATIGAQLLVRWGLPADLTQAVGFHFDAPQCGAPYERLTAMVQIASDIADQTNGGRSQAQVGPLKHPEAMEILELKDKDIPGLIAETRKGLEQVAGLSTLSFDAGI
jgi:putative nucleotidyltransferase with HDIG domain